MNDSLDLALGFAALPEPFRDRIEAELAPSERLLWASRPDPNRPRGPRRSSASLKVWILGWLGLGAICSMAIMPVSMSLFAWVVVPLLAVAVTGWVVGFLLTVHWLAEFVEQGFWRRRSKLDLYALTDRRALIWNSLARSTAVRVSQYLPGTIRSDMIERLEYPNGLGDLTWTGGIVSSDPAGFLGVTEVRRVDELVRQVLVKPRLAAEPIRHRESDDFEETF